MKKPRKPAPRRVTRAASRFPPTFRGDPSNKKHVEKYVQQFEFLNQLKDTTQ